MSQCEGSSAGRPLFRIDIVADFAGAEGLVFVEAFGLEVLAEEVATEEIRDLADAVGGVDMGGDACGGDLMSEKGQKYGGGERLIGMEMGG